ncbi:MAG: strawberry notch family protein [Planctomycetota bacterium]
MQRRGPGIGFGGERPRFKQLTDWLGPDFDGVVAFDEAHLMNNAVATLPRAPTQAPLPDSSV